MYTFVNGILTIQNLDDLAPALTFVKSLPRQGLFFRMGSVYGELTLARQKPDDPQTVWCWQHVLATGSYTKCYRSEPSYFAYVNLPGVMIMSSSRELYLIPEVPRAVIEVIYGGRTAIPTLTHPDQGIKDHLKNGIHPDFYQYLYPPKATSADILPALSTIFGERQARIIAKQLS